MDSPSASGDVSINPSGGSGENPEKAESIKNEDPSTTIEQSVRAFRLFEILRNGDTTAISKAIKEAKDDGSGTTSSGTTILHLAIQCAESQVVDFVLASGPDIDVNARDREGNTPLHLASQLGRDVVVKALLEQPLIDDSVVNYRGQTALDLARTPEIFQQLQLSRSIFIDAKTKQIQDMVIRSDYDALGKLLEEPRVQGTVDVNALDLVTDTVTSQTGGTLLHEGARKRDTSLLQILLVHGADPFRRDKKGKLPQDVTKDDKTKAIVKKSPAAVIAQRGIQERAILGNSPSAPASHRAVSMEATIAGKDAREMKGYLKKWTNYTSGFKLRWFVLEDGVLSYYKHQGWSLISPFPFQNRQTNVGTDDAGSACRGAISMRIAKLHMDAQDKTRFEIHGKSSVKYHLKANHVVEAKRWFWALNNAIQWGKDEAKEEERRRNKDAEVLQAKLQRVDSRVSDSQGEPSSSRLSPSKGLAAPKSTTSFSRVSTQTSRTPAESTFTGGDDDTSAYGSYAQSVTQTDIQRHTSHPVGPDGDVEYDDYNDYASSRGDVQPANKDAFYITAQSAKLQLDLLSNVSSSLQVEKTKNPDLTVSDPAVDRALTAYNSAVGSLNGLLANLMKISRDRDAYWQYRLDKESDTRKMWEDSMARIVQEHEDLQSKVGESEEKRKRTKKALKEVLEISAEPDSKRASQTQLDETVDALEEAVEAAATEQPPPPMTQEVEKVDDVPVKRLSISEYADLAESDSDDDEAEFFDAIESDELEVQELVSVNESAEKPPVDDEAADLRSAKLSAITPSFKGYEDPVRQRLKMDNDDRPKISLWVCLIYSKRFFPC
jgi:hypothetical protein